jgi:hypothetical protein
MQQAATVMSWRLEGERVLAELDMSRLSEQRARRAVAVLRRVVAAQGAEGGRGGQPERGRRPRGRS